MRRRPKVAVCHGGAEGVYEESAEVLELLARAGARVVMIAANEAGIDLPVLHHWGSLHPNKFRFWTTLRRERGRPDGYELWSLNKNHLAQNCVRNWRGGSSGLHVVDIAVNALGLDAAICCGIPMDERKNYFRGRAWGQFNSFRSAWTDRAALAVLRPRVRSMSGWTRELLGAPTEEWLSSLPPPVATSAG